MKNGVLSKNLRKWSTLLGVCILLISVYLSFDGFDGTVNGANSEYSALGVVIGVVFALAVTLMQFIFTSDYRGLNPTLKPKEKQTIPRLSSAQRKGKSG